MLLQLHVKDPGYSAKSAGYRLQLNTLIPLTQQSQSGLIILTRIWDPVRETSSHVTCQGMLVQPSLSSLSHCGLILSERVELVHAN